MSIVVLDDVLVGSINQKQKGKFYSYPIVRLPVDPFVALVGQRLKRVTVEYENGVVVSEPSLPMETVVDGTVMVPSGV